METNYIRLKNYYKLNYKQLLFLEEKKIDNNNSIHMYIYDYKDELDNFKKTFNNYFPFYVDNYDSIKFYKLDGDIEFELDRQSRKLWNSSYVDHRDIEKWGIFGELLVDFLIRIVYEKEVMLTYASKKAYNDRNEFKGIDNLACYLEKDKLEIILSEVKFVATISTAKSDLVSDIKGSYNKNGEMTQKGHLNEGTINDYIGGFALKQQESVDKITLSNTKDKIDMLNKRIVCDDEKFIDAMNDLDFRIRFVYFAIFQSKYKQPNDILNYYTDIINTFNDNISSVGIKNYDMDVIFIPTDNKSVDIKKKMVEIYD